MSRTTRIQAENQGRLQLALERFGDHENMTEGRILAWLLQFADADVSLALRVIEKIKYYNAVNIRTMTRQLFQLARDQLQQQGHKKAVFVAVGDPGSGSGIVARA